MVITTADRTTVTATGRTAKERRWHPRRAMLLAGLLGAAAVVVTSGCGGRPEDRMPVGSPSGATPFVWFRAGAAPSGWQSMELPDRTAVLSVPPDATPMPGDPGSVSAVVTGPHGELRIYLNATPQQGAESATNWAGFRLAHLTGENAASATRLSYRARMPFRGGTGACVEDTYITRIGAHKYREMACLVTGSRGGSVLVVATPAPSWDRDRAVLEQAVDAYVAE